MTYQKQDTKQKEAKADSKRPELSLARTKEESKGGKKKTGANPPR